MGQIEEPDSALLAYLRGLLGNGYWKDHLIEAVFVGHRQYIEWLAREGVLGEWLESREDKDVGVACWLLRGVGDKSPDFVAEILQPYAGRDDEWANRVLNCLCWSVEDDSERMFRLRLQLARKGVTRDWVHWAPLAEKHPGRAIQLIEAVVSTWSPGDPPEDGDGKSRKRGTRSRLEQWSGDDLKTLKDLAAKRPESVWDQLVPHIERLTDVDDGDAGRLGRWVDGDEFGVYEGYKGTARGIVDLVIAAGGFLAAQDGDAFLTRTERLRNSRSLTTQLILAKSYAALPSDCANEGLRWLMADPARVSLGSGYREPQWMPAARLVQALSPHCDESVLRELEDFLIHYHAPDEQRMAQYHATTWKEGYFGDYWGRAQHFLLRSVCPERRSNETAGLVGVLERKFHDYRDWRFLRSAHTTGGSVGSPLPTAKLADMSDKVWLSIICNKEIPERSARRWKQITKDRVAESALRHFSCDLANVATRFPSHQRVHAC